MCQIRLYLSFQPWWAHPSSIYLTLVLIFGYSQLQDSKIHHFCFVLDSYSFLERVQCWGIAWVVGPPQNRYDPCMWVEIYHWGKWCMQRLVKGKCIIVNCTSQRNEFRLLFPIRTLILWFDALLLYILTGWAAWVLRTYASFAHSICGPLECPSHSANIHVWCGCKQHANWKTWGSFKQSFWWKQDSKPQNQWAQRGSESHWRSTGPCPKRVWVHQGIFCCLTWEVQAFQKLSWCSAFCAWSKIPMNILEISSPSLKYVMWLQICTQHGLCSMS